MRRASTLPPLQRACLATCSVHSCAARRALHQCMRRAPCGTRPRTVVLGSRHLGHAHAHATHALV
eukprot:9601148-Alexandrium_andersonii.AAC.1